MLYTHSMESLNKTDNFDNHIAYHLAFVFVTCSLVKYEKDEFWSLIYN